MLDTLYAAGKGGPGGLTQAFRRHWQLFIEFRDKHLPGFLRQSRYRPWPVQSLHDEIRETSIRKTLERPKN